MATAEDIRRFQVHQAETGVSPPTVNCSVSALRFFFTVTLDRPELSWRWSWVIINATRRWCSASRMSSGCLRRRQG
jgi:hypothetical protein